MVLFNILFEFQEIFRLGFITIIIIIIFSRILPNLNLHIQKYRGSDRFQLLQLHRASQQIWSSMHSNSLDQGPFVERLVSSGMFQSA